MVVFLAHALCLLAAWTLVIKFAFPVAWALVEGAPVGTYIMWDFWWVIHLWLARALLVGQRHAPAFALAVSIVEIAIISVKFTMFLSAPEWTIWTANWFVNKLFVLACFVVMLAYFGARRRGLPTNSATSVP